MFLYYIIIILYIPSLSGQIIKNGIYNLMIYNLYLYSIKEKISLSEKYKYPNTFMRVKIIVSNINNTFYIIEKLSQQFKLGYSDNKEINFNLDNADSHLWNFIKLNNSQYITYLNMKLFCENIPIYKATKFKLIKIFSELKKNINSKDFELLNNEPIDIIIKYIDLTDKNLERKKVHQIEKDYDNEELKYSIRSILKNIPWIRKIFILMPNKKVRYFKNYNIIKEKIVYINDKDLLGYDSSNSNSFQFRYWKMKKFGISDNIIIMDDDYFIGKKLEKYDFFYVKNGKVVPLIITSNFIKINKQFLQTRINNYKSELKKNKKEQDFFEFLYSKYLTFNFILDIFNIYFQKNIYLPNFTHNAIPINIYEVKEVFNLVYNSNYKYNTLDCSYRISGYIQFQTMIMSYTFIKYKRRVKNISYKYINLNNAIYENYTKKLFCINKGADNYSIFDLFKEKIAMEYLFPIPSPYEVVENPILDLSLNIVYSMDQFLKTKQNILTNTMKEKKIIFIEKNVIIISFLLLIKISLKKFDLFY